MSTHVRSFIGLFRKWLCHFNPCPAEYFYVLRSSPIFKHSIYEHVFTSRVENSVDPDQLVSSVFTVFL